MSLLAAWTRGLRAGRPIVVVSGLPRSGTSMAMRMLDVGGLPVMTDGIRHADVSNPNGYYELERVKTLEGHGDARWLADARGKAVKIISFLLTWLPETYDYRVVFMDRRLDEVLASQDAMLRHRGEAAAIDAARDARALYEEHLRQVDRFLSRRSCFSVLRLDYAQVVTRPGDAAARLADFVKVPLDVARMTAVADPALYRNRREAGLKIGGYGA
jgi:hypothetical protein